MTPIPSELVARSERLAAWRFDGAWPRRVRLRPRMARSLRERAWVAVEHEWRLGTRDHDRIYQRVLADVTERACYSEPEFIDPMTLFLIAKLVMIVVELWLNQQASKEAKRHG